VRCSARDARQVAVVDRTLHSSSRCTGVLSIGAALGTAAAPRYGPRPGARWADPRMHPPRPHNNKTQHNNTKRHTSHNTAQHETKTKHQNKTAREQLAGRWGHSSCWSLPITMGPAPKIMILREWV
jgi:hypothetical protein